MVFVGLETMSIGAYALTAFRRTSPLEVANMTLLWLQLPSSSGSGMMVEMVSPSSSGSKLMRALPRAWGLPSGIFQTFDL